MKKRITMVLLAGMTSAALGFSALAADVSGLSAFLDARSYVDGSFVDVDAGAWYSAGVKTVYEKNIMDGMGNGVFDPSGTVTWAQAVTIAARLHATYHGASVPVGQGTWYSGYMTYAGDVGLLPTAMPEGDTVVWQTISRQELAALFSKVFDEQDLPAVKEALVPDLKKVLPEYQSAVQKMYASGIITGKDGGRFDPEGVATRAEIAVIVTRLLSPGQRRIADSAADQNMADQWGNYKSGGYAVQQGDVTYYTVRERTETESWKYSIIARTDSGETRSVYETEKQLTRLAAADDGLLYFVEGKNTLRSLDPALGEGASLYTSPEQLMHFTFYGGKVYVFECYSKNGLTADWKYRIGRVEKNGLAILVNNMDQQSVTHLDVLHAVNGKLYYCFGDASSKYSIWSLELETGRKRQEYAGEIFGGEVCFSGAVYWHYRENGEGCYEILRGNLLMPEYEEVLTALPREAATQYHYLYANGERLFFQSSGAARIWEIDPSGYVSELVKLPGASYERSSVTEQGVIMHALESLSVLMPQQIVVQLPDGNRQSYLQFLNLPYWENGASVRELGGQEMVWDDCAVVEGEVIAAPKRAYYTVDGDLVVEVELCNGLNSEISPVMITLILAEEEREIRTVFYWMDNVAAGKEKTVSLVVTAEKLGEPVDLTVMEKSVALKYSKKG